MAAELAEFLDRYDPSIDLFLLAYDENEALVGSITIDSINATEKGAHLRWFIVKEGLVGQGLGKQLMSKAIEHCDSHGMERCYLTTFEGLHAARALYDSFGFVLSEVKNEDQWNGNVRELLFFRHRPS